MHSGAVHRPTHELAFAAAITAARIKAGRTKADIAEQVDLPLSVVKEAEQGGGESLSAKPLPSQRHSGAR